jgi:hypothetical protein
MDTIPQPPMPDTAADLTALAAWIDEQIGDETADRQWIAVSAASRVRDITLQMMGAAELARQAAPGPFETRDQVRRLPAVQAVYEAFRADPGAGKMAPHNEAMLTGACQSAGVELGAFDHRIVAWLAAWEPETCAVVAGLIARAAVGRGVTASPDLATVLGALEHAGQLMRERADAWCEECATSPSEACQVHLDQLDQADAYRALAERLGGAR